VHRRSLGREDAGSVGHPGALINRYVVDRVEADLMLGFFFPGAVMVVTGGHESVAAGATDVAAATVATPGAATDAAASSAEGTPSVPGVA